MIMFHYTQVHIAFKTQIVFFLCLRVILDPPCLMINQESTSLDLKLKLFNSFVMVKEHVPSFTFYFIVFLF